MFHRTIAALLPLSLFVFSAATFAQDSGGPTTNRTKEAPSEETTEVDVLGEWAKTFSGENAASYIPKGDSPRLIVVAAGEHTEVEQATDVLEKALRDTGRFKLVMNDDMLADNTKLDDEKIVMKAKHLPVRYMAVVRVFDAGAGQPPSAVVTLYDKASREALTAMSATRGTPLETNAQAVDSPGSGVSKKAAEAVAETTEAQLEKAQADQPGLSDRELARAKQEYLESYVWFEDVTAVNQYGSVVAQWSNIYRGKYKKPLEGEEFYEEVGKPKLAKKYRTRQALQWTGIFVGAAAAGGGLWYALSGPSSSGVWGDGFNDCSRRYSDGGEEDEFDACMNRVEAEEARIDEERELRLTTGMIISAVGSLAMVGLAYFNPHPVDPSEAKRLADKHNRRLKRRLGLAGELDDEQASNLSWSIDATGSADGGGLRLRVDF